MSNSGVTEKFIKKSWKFRHLIIKYLAK